jgi:hypothetical protein
MNLPIIPDDVWPPQWKHQSAVDIKLADGRTIENLMVKPDTREICGKFWPPLGEPGPLKEKILSEQIIAVRARGGWRDYAGFRRLFPHPWHYKQQSIRPNR